jgi:hypothetical protein
MMAITGLQPSSFLAVYKIRLSFANYNCETNY